jgi:hypothetical protein
MRCTTWISRSKRTGTTGISVQFARREGDGKCRDPGFAANSVAAHLTFGRRCPFLSPCADAHGHGVGPLAVDSCARSSAELITCCDAANVCSSSALARIVSFASLSVARTLQRVLTMERSSSLVHRSSICIFGMNMFLASQLGGRISPGRIYSAEG